VSATRVFPESVSNPAAREELLNILRNEAVSKKVPRTIEVASLLTDVMSETDGRAHEQTAWSGFFKSTVSGVITQERIVAESDPAYLAGMSSYEKSLTLEAYVEPVKGNRDPGFTVKAELHDNTLSSGEELLFTLTPTQDSYLYAFNLMADHSVLLVFPNDYMPDNHLSAGETVQIPDPNMRGYVRFRVGTMPGEELTTESIYVVCTKDIVTLADDLPRIGTDMPASGDSKSFIKLQRWLTNIPLAKVLPSGLKATDITSCPWPVRVWISSNSWPDVHVKMAISTKGRMVRRLDFVFMVSFLIILTPPHDKSNSSPPAGPAGCW